MECSLRGPRFWAGAFLSKVHDATCDTILENELFQAQFQALWDSRIHALARLAILYRLCMVTCITVICIAVYAAGAIYKEFMLSVLTHFCRTVRRSIMPAAEEHLVRLTPVKVTFSDAVSITSTYSSTEYDRSNGQRECLRPESILAAHHFLLHYKQHEMAVHPESEHHTHHFKLR